MADLWWLVVMLTMLLSAGSSSAAVDQNKLGPIVDKILNRYTPQYMAKNNRERNPMFSLAVTIPYNSQTKTYDVTQVLDSEDDVKKTILNCDVYVGSRVVAATFLKWPDVVDQCPDGHVQWEDVIAACPEGVKTWADVKKIHAKECREKLKGRADHAEYRVLQKFPSFQKQNRNDLLLFYVRASPCDKKCTNTDDAANILYSIKKIKQWDDYAFVFSNIFKPRNGAEIEEKTLRESLERLGKHDPGPIGLSNIFRCSGGVCASCSSNNNVLPYCYSDESQPGSSILPPSSFTQPEQGTSGSTSRSDNNIKMSAGRSSDADSDIRAVQDGSSPGLGRESKGGKGAKNTKSMQREGKKQNKVKSLFCCSGK